MARRSSVAIDSEITLMRCQMRILERREEEVNRVLEDMTRVRDNLRADKQALFDRSIALEGEKWPINWLPNELLINILVECSNSDWETGELYHKPPVIMSHVCKKWRKVCLETSHIWSRISHKSGAFSRAALSTFIERSKNCPLDLVVQSPRRDERFRRDPDNAASYVLAELRPHMSRLNSIIFQCQGPAVMEEMVDIINSPNCDLSGLQSLALGIMEDRPWFGKTLSLLGLGNTRRQSQTGTIEYTPQSNTSLQQLRLEQVSYDAFKLLFLSDKHHLRFLFAMYRVIYS